MSTIKIALLAAGLLTAAGTLHAQTPQPSGSTPSTSQPAPDVDKAERPPGTDTRGVEGSTGTQGGPDPAPMKDSTGRMAPGGTTPPSATDPATGRDIDRSSATKGVPADKGAQAGPAPDKAKDKDK